MTTIPTNFRPMLAAREKPTEVELEEHLHYGLIASPKVDGLRCTVFDGVAYSRSMKPFRNRHIQSFVRRFGDVLGTLDGEMVVGSPTAGDCYRRSSSGIMSYDGEPDFHYHIFDTVQTGYNYKERLQLLTQREGIQPTLRGKVQELDHTTCYTIEEVLAAEEKYLKQGYEGIILRRWDAAYKYGRSTVKQGGMMKLKRFLDSEAEVLEICELMRNDNDLEEDNFGLAKRSHSVEGKYGGETMGFLHVRDIHTGIEFKIGTGFSAVERDIWWGNIGERLGWVVKYKYLPVGVKDKPRHPVFLGVREREDLG